MAEILRRWKTLLVVCVANLLVRVALHPLSQTVETDAILRTISAREWLDQPRFMTWGVWGPLHFYLLSTALALVPDQVVAPILLNVLFSTATAIVLYVFTYIAFSQAGAAFVALAYGLSPLVVRHSLMAVSETPFAFFVACSLLLAAITRKGSSRLYALLCGGSLTLAGALRYEAWALMPFFYVLISLPSPLAGVKRRSLAPLVGRPSQQSLCFLASSLVFPAFWMLGSWLHSGDPFLGIHTAKSWQIDVLGINEQLTLPRLVERLAFFPSMVVFGPTPAVLTLALLGLCLAGHRQREKVLWILPFAGLLTILTFQALTGGVLLKGRYSIVLVMMLLPFASLVFDLFERKLRIWVATAIAVSMLPFVVYLQVTGSFPEANPIPRLPQAARLEIETASRLIRDSGRGGLLLEAWGSTLYLALVSGRRPDELFLVHGAKDHVVFDCDRLNDFLSRHSAGVAVLGNGSSWARVGSRGELTFEACPSRLAVERLVDLTTSIFIWYRRK